MRVRIVVLAVLATALLAARARAQTEYPLGPDSERHDAVPRGTVTKHAWASRIYPGTEREYWVYVPAQYRAGTPAAVMVFQDGGRFVAEDGRWRIPLVFDNLIQKGEMPVTIGVFVDPGILPAASPARQARFDRSFEYDALGDRYARFLVEEILPEVGKSYALSLDPDLRAIGGASSGGIAALTAAWNRPDAFRRVLSFIGSYTGLRGGDTYPTLVRKTEPKPIRVFLEDGSRDLDIYSGSWWIGNQALASALEYAGYDVQFVRGDRGHDAIHGSSVLPDALRWLWRDWTQPLAASKGRAGAERHFVTDILDPASPAWDLVAQGEGPIGGLAVDGEGDVLFSDGRAIRKVEVAANKTAVYREAPGAGALAFAPDHRLYAATKGAGLVAFDGPGHAATILGGLVPADLVIGAQGDVWLTDPERRKVWTIDRAGRRRSALDGAAAGTLALSPDQSLLMIASPGERTVWSHELGLDGIVRHGEPFYLLEPPDETSDAAAAGMAVDSEGFLYVASPQGIQVFDQPGRLNAVLTGPPGAAVSRLAFGGPKLDTLYAAAADKLYRRRLRRKGVFPWQPVTPPVPGL